MAKRNYGWQPDLPDKRDYLFRKVMAPLPAAAAKSIYAYFASPIEDQGVWDPAVETAPVAGPGI